MPAARKFASIHICKRLGVDIQWQKLYNSSICYLYKTGAGRKPCASKLLEGANDYYEIHDW